MPRHSDHCTSFGAKTGKTGLSVQGFGWRVFGVSYDTNAEDAQSTSARLFQASVQVSHRSPGARELSILGSCLPRWSCNGIGSGISMSISILVLRLASGGGSSTDISVCYRV